MKGLESVVLPLPEPRALAEAGIALDTVAWWQRSLAHIDHPMSVHIKGDNSELGIEDFFEDVCPAPTLSELLDAIRAKVGEPADETTIILSRDGSEAGANWVGVRTEDAEYEIAQAPTDLIAAYQLLREVNR